MAAVTTPTPSGPGRRYGLLLPIAVAALGLAAIGVAENLPARHSIEANLADRSDNALRSAGFTDATALFVGRDGTVYVDSATDANRALAIVRAQTGVRVARVVVGHASGSPAPATTTPPSATTAQSATTAPPATAAAQSATTAPSVTAASSVPAVPAPAAPAAPPAAAAPPSTSQSPPAAPPTSSSPTAADVQKLLNALGQIDFRPGSAVLAGQSGPRLAAIGAILNASPSIRVQIQGYTDSSGSAAFNLALSRARAGAVYTALRGHSVSAARMTAVGYGETHPRVPNTSEANRAINRRVEFAVSG